MDNHKTDYLTALKYLLIPINLIFLIVLLLNLAGTLPPAFKTIYFFYFTLFIDTAFLALKINNLQEYEIEHNSVIHYSKYFFLLTLIIIALNQFLNRQIVNDTMSYFVGLSIATGFLTFYSSRDKISSEIESEKDKEATAESRRRDEFAMKFPSINKIPVIRKVVRWMYKEGWWYSALLLLILLIASGNIFVGLGDNDFFHDEQYHVAVVKSVLSGEGFRVWDFTINAPSERVYDSGYITNIFA